MLLAIHLLRADRRVHIRLIERSACFGLGRAYQTSNPHHLLNVRAANMSPFPDQPDHFQAWLGAEGSGEDQDVFVSRGRYGAYLQSLLAEELSEGAGRLELIGEEALSVDREDSRWRIRLGDGRGLEADAVVLALGMAPPSAPLGADVQALSDPAYCADPWAADLANLPGRDVLLIGSGLTMVDVALSLGCQGRRLTALSRRGLTPLPHAPTRSTPPPSGSLGSPLQALRTLRIHAGHLGWREAVDSIRPLTPDIWQRWDAAQKRQFLRHAQAWWDVHRHRTAPRIAERLDDMRASGALNVRAGRLQALHRSGDRFSAVIRLRGRLEATVETFDAVVNCTSTQSAASALKRGLLENLARSGFIRADPLGLGLDVDRTFAAIGPDGAITPGLFAIGPLTRGRFWESIAVPDLRGQTLRAAVEILAQMT